MLKNTNPAGISEVQFREAAKQFEDGSDTLDRLYGIVKEVLAAGNNDQKVLSVEEAKKKIREQYESLCKRVNSCSLAKARQALAATKTIYEGLPAYISLVSDSRTTYEYGLRPSQLGQAYMIQYLQPFGPMTLGELCEMHATEEGELVNVIWQLFPKQYDNYQRRLRSELAIPSVDFAICFRRTIGFISGPLSGEWCFGGKIIPKDEDVIAVNFKLINDKIHFRNPISQEQFLSQHYPDLVAEVAQAKQKVDHFKIPTFIRPSEKEDDLNYSIQKIKQQISENDDAIVRLRKKIFGKKKAQEEIAELEKKNSNCRHEIGNALDELELLEKERANELLLAQSEAEKERANLQAVYDALCEQQKEKINQYTKWYDIEDILEGL